MILGVTGTYASGKDTVAEYLAKKGFLNISLSDFIRDYCRKAGQELTRENLIAMGNQLRSNFGFEYLAKLARDRISSQGADNAVITSIRHPSEVIELKKSSDFKLILVSAPVEMRFNRMLARPNRPDDMNTLELFIQNEKLERTGTAAGQQLDAVGTMADYVINNDLAQEALYEKIDQIITS